jgi:predicted O-linked N-acetylglucosamine transferase (SPINDLY family)
MAGSQLHAIGLPELVSTDMASYEALAFELARDSGTCAALRARLAANRVTQPLFDMHRFTKGFEDCIARVWANSVGGRPQL